MNIGISVGHHARRQPGQLAVDEDGELSDNTRVPPLGEKKGAKKPAKASDAWKAMPVYDPVKPRAAREFAVWGSMTWRLTASAVRVSDELKFRYGFPPVPPDWDRDASRTTDAFA